MALTYVPVYLELGNGGVGVILGNANGPWQPPPIFFDRETRFCDIFTGDVNTGGGNFLLTGTGARDLLPGAG